MKSARAYALTGAEYPEQVLSEDDDAYPGLSARLKTPRHHPPDTSNLPGFAQALEGLKQQEQDLYADLIFGQWREINAAFAVILTEVFAAQQ